MALACRGSCHAGTFGGGRPPPPLAAAAAARRTHCRLLPAPACRLQLAQVSKQLFHATRSHGTCLFQELPLTFSDAAPLRSFARWLRRTQCAPRMLILQVWPRSAAVLGRPLQRAWRVASCDCHCRNLRRNAGQRAAAAAGRPPLVPPARPQQGGDADGGEPATWDEVTAVVQPVLPSLTHLLIRYDGQGATGAGPGRPARARPPRGDALPLPLLAPAAAPSPRCRACCVQASGSMAARGCRT